MSDAAISLDVADSTSVATRRYIALWLLVGILIIIDTVWCMTDGYTVPIQQIATHAAVPLGLCIVSAALLFGGSRILSGRPLHFARRLQVALAWIALTMVASEALVILQYLCVAVDAPLIDAQLIRADALMGFSWLAMARWHLSHPFVTLLLWLVYHWLLCGVPIVIALLAWMNQDHDLSEFVMLFVSVTLCAIIISAPFPATNPRTFFASAIGHYGFVLRYFFDLRSQAAHLMPLDKPLGLVSMPSLHAADAVLLAYATRHLRKLFPLSVVLNGTMIWSALFIGGHYLCDIIAGIALAIVAMLIIRRARGV